MNTAPLSSPVMIWQIFKKDIKLLWPLAAALIACELALLLLTGSQRPIGQPELNVLIADRLLRFIILSGSGLLILLAVQQDPLPGLGQDWLARPIRRRDLFLAKLLFAGLMIHVPVLVTGVIHGVWEGFPLGASLVAALSRSLSLLLLLTLPLLTAGALTRHLTEVLIGGVLVGIGGLLTLLLIALLVIRITHEPSFNVVTIPTGVGWVWASLSLAVSVAAMLAVLALLYAKRQVLAARVVFCIGLGICVLVLFLPFAPAFAVQIWLSPPSRAQREISVVFDPAHAPPPARVAGAPDDAVNLLLHLRYAGVPAGAVLNVDHSRIRVVDEAGRTLFRGPAMGNPFPSVSAGGSQVRDEQLMMPGDTYRRLRDQPVRLEINQYMTLLKVQTLPPLPAAGGDRRLPGVGRCLTRVDRTGAALEAGCMAAGELPPCLSMALTLPSGAHNPPVSKCLLNYAPWRTRLSLQVVSEFIAKLPFADPSGQVRYPVDESRLREAQVVVTVYEPSDHFVAHVQAAVAHLRDLAVPLRGLLPPAPSTGPNQAPGIGD